MSDAASSSLGYPSQAQQQVFRQCGSIDTDDPIELDGPLQVTGFVKSGGNINLSGDVIISGSLEAYGPLTINGNLSCAYVRVLFLYAKIAHMLKQGIEEVSRHTATLP